MSTDVVLAGEVFGGAELVPAGITADVAELVRQWLIAHAGGSEHTFRAYRRGIGEWLTWCAEHGVDPLDAARTDVDAWHRLTAQIPTQRGTLPSRATMAQRVSVVASWYRFLVDEEVIDTFPIRRRTRPKAGGESRTVGLSAAEADALEDALHNDATVLERAILQTLLWQALRISELLTMRIDALGHDAGVRVMHVHGKGDKTRTISIDPAVATTIDELLTTRFGQNEPPGDVLLFTTTAVPLTRQSVTRDLQRIARAAGIPSHARLSPHSLRHTCATLMLNGGAPLHAVQAFLGHSSPETTIRYDRARGALDRSVAAQASMRRHVSTPHRTSSPGGP